MRGTRRLASAELQLPPRLKLPRRGGGTGLYKEIEGVAILYAGFRDELVVCERRALEEEARVSAGGAAGYAIESVGCTARLYCAGGRRLLIVSVSVADEVAMDDRGGGTGKRLPFGRSW
jgi:hypothetical protein